MLRVLELLGGNPLAPLVEVNTVGQLETFHLDARRGGTRQVLGQLDRALALNKSAPERVVGQFRTATFDEVIQLALAMIRARSRKDQFESLTLGLPGTITIDQVLTTVELAGFVTQLLDSLARGLRQGCELFDVLRANVDRVEPATRHRQVRRGLQRRNRLGCVHRVNEQEVCTLVRTDGCKIREIGRISNTPRRSRTRRVQLSVDTPRTTRGLQERQRERIGNNDQGCRLYVAALNRGHETMPAERQPVRHIKGRTADELAVDHTGRNVAIHLVTRTFATIFEHPLDVDPRAVWHMHREEVPAALAGDNRRREGTTPFALVGDAQRLMNIPHRGGFIKGQAESTQDLEKGGGADAHPIPVPIPESGSNAISIGDTAQLIDVVRCGSVNIHRKAFYVAG